MCTTEAEEAGYREGLEKENQPRWRMGSEKRQRIDLQHGKSVAFLGWEDTVEDNMSADVD